jgi:hypothetical protein
MQCALCGLYTSIKSQCYEMTVYFSIRPLYVQGYERLLGNMRIRHMNGRTDGQVDRQTDVPELIIASRNFAYARDNTARW